MARKGWDQLSSGYRDRIIKAGMTREDYEAGRSLAKARGHSKTPERPSSFDPKKFPQYASERQRLANDLVRQKRAFFYKQPKWNPLEAKKIIDKLAPPLKDMRKALSWTVEQWINAIRENPEKWAFLGYH